MRYCLRTAPAIILLSSIAACSIVDQVRFTVAEYAARAVVAECSLSDTERHTNLTAVNGWLATNGRLARAISLDCNGDGAPDLSPG